MSGRTVLKVTVGLSDDEARALVELSVRWNLNRVDALREAVRRAWSAPPLWDLVSVLERRCTRIEAGETLTDTEVLVAQAHLSPVLEQTPAASASGILTLLLLRLLEAHCTNTCAWFYPPVPCTAEAARSAVAEGKSRLPAAYLRAVFPSFWVAGDGPAGWSFSDPRYARAIAATLGFARSPGVDFTLAHLRRQMRTEKFVVSFFQPSIAYALYRELLADATAPCVWDPSGGFGGRMLGFAAAYPRGTYLANEPAAATRRDLDALRASLQLAGSTSAAGSEDATFSANSLDLVFTSPPYFAQEQYFDEPTQSYIKFPAFDLWVGGFVRPTLAAAWTALKPGRFAVFNVGSSLAQTFVEQAEAVGFTLARQGTLPLRQLPFVKQPQAEPILYFRKPE